MSVVSVVRQTRQFDVMKRARGVTMTRNATATLTALAMLVPISGQAFAQDIPGIEICTVEKTMERRTSCLQSNVNFLQGTINKLTADHQQKLDAATRQIDALKATVVSLQKSVEELQASQKKMADEFAKKPDAASKDTAPKAGSK
jgi:hypothetical protein